MDPTLLFVTANESYYYLEAGLPKGSKGCPERLRYKRRLRCVISHRDCARLKKSGPELSSA